MSESLATPGRLLWSSACDRKAHAAGRRREVVMPRVPHAGERFPAALGCARRGIPVVPLHHPVAAGQPARYAASVLVSAEPVQAPIPVPVRD